MPMIILQGTDVAGNSGGIPLVSGNPWSGGTVPPVGVVRLQYDNSGLSFIQVALSGGLGILSGGMPAGGFQMVRGDKIEIPKIGLASGVLSIRIGVPAAASGSRLYWEAL